MYLSRAPLSIALVLVAMLTASCSQGHQFPDCKPLAGFSKASLPSGLPRALQDAMKWKSPPEISKDAQDAENRISLPGEYFNASFGRRYIFAWSRGANWIVAIEQGGGIYSQGIDFYSLSADGKTASLIKEQFVDERNETVCTRAAKMAGELL